MENYEVRSVIPDNRNRIALGDLAKGVSRFDITFNHKDDTIILKPYVDIPRKEAWLLNNPDSMRDLRKGMEDVKAGKVGNLDADIQDDINAEIARLKNEL